MAETNGLLNRRTGTACTAGSNPALSVSSQVIGDTCVTKTWYAEYCLEARRHYEPLGTTNKAAAVKQAHAIVQRIESGLPGKPNRRVDISTLRREYT